MSDLTADSTRETRASTFKQGEQLARYLWQHPFVRFFFVGGFTTVIQFILLILFIEIVNLHPTLASVGGYLGGAVCNYLLNYYFTFDQAAEHKTAIFKFCVVVFIGVNVNALLFTIFLSFLPWYLLAQCFAVLGTLIVNYTLHKFWIYRGEK